MEDILLPRPWRVRYEINRYHCSNCEEIVKEKPKDLPPDGRLGKQVTILHSLLAGGAGLAANKMKKHLDTVGISLSEATITIGTFPLRGYLPWRIPTETTKTR